MPPFPHLHPLMCGEFAPFALGKTHSVAETIDNNHFESALRLRCWHTSVLDPFSEPS
jgi:hypothetical protein